MEKSDEVGMMNDYKELLGDIGDCLIAQPSEALCKRLLKQAADAIEQLVNDRNASVDALKALVENIDAVSVVRCKDCECWECGQDTKGEIYKSHLCDVFECGTTADDFCSYGERKGGDE